MKPQAREACLQGEHLLKKTELLVVVSYLLVMSATIWLGKDDLVHVLSCLSGEGSWVNTS